MTMPIFESLRKDFEKRSVVFLAVNVREDKETIRKFLKKTNRKLGTVVLDSDGKVASEYGITGFPQSFLIGKDGKVNVVFRGFSSDIEAKFKVELEKALNVNTQE